MKEPTGPGQSKDDKINSDMMKGGIWENKDGKMRRVQGEKSEPKIEIADDYSEALENKEKAESMKSRLANLKSLNEISHKGLMDALADTRTNAAYRKYLDDKFMKNMAGEAFPTNEDDLTKQRIQKAEQLNENIREKEEFMEATSIAADYFEYVKKGLESAGSESEVVAKTIETIEGEEQEIATKLAKQEATEEDRTRLARLADARNILKKLSEK